MANPHYASLSGMPLPPTSSSSSSDKLETISNYDTEPAPSYFDKSYSYDKYMAEFPRAPGSPSNSSQVELLSQFADSNSHQNLEQLQSATGFGAGLVCLCAETLVGYPFIVLRRQCQVNMWCKAADLSPYLMLKAIYQIQKRQGMPALWKGFTCHMMMEGLQLTTDSCISHVTQLPKELPSFSEGLTRTMGYVTLKTVSTIATLPILSAVLLDTVQSESARAESATPMSCLKDAIYRFTGSGSSYQYRLLLPVHQLIIPTVVYTLTWDLVGHLVHSSVLKLCKMRQNSKQSNKDSRRQPNNTLTDSIWPELLAGTVHCFVADLSLLPLELIMNRLHLQGTRAIVDNVLDAQSVIPYQASYNNVQQCVEALVDSEGVPSFWKGCSALLLQYSTRFAVVHTVRILLKYINNFSDKPSLVPNDSATSLEK